MKKIILHLCADLGSDSLYYQKDERFEVIMVGQKVGVENYIPPPIVHGIIANPVCTEFSTINGFDKKNDLKKGMFLVNHCLRIMELCTPKFCVIENPFNGRLKEIIGEPKYVYQPWQYGSPWTKKTALWGHFNIPSPLYNNWDDVPNKIDLWRRKGRKIPSLAYLHKSAIHLIPEMQWAKDNIKKDSDIRSMCSNGFAKAFYEANQ